MVKTKLTTIGDLRAEIERIEGILGIGSDITVPLRDRVSHVLNVTDSIPHDQPITHEEIRYIGDVYYLRDLEIAGDVLCNTDQYVQRRDENGRFASGIRTIPGEQVY